VHNRHQQGVGPEGADELPFVDTTLGINRDEVDLKSAPLEVLADLENRGVLDRGGDDMTALAVLLLSVAQEVKRTSDGLAWPSKRATVLRAARMASAGPRAASYIELGLKYSPDRNGEIASTTSGATCVVALLSR